MENFLPTGIKRLGLFLFSLFCLGSCGFRSTYSQNSPIAPEIEAIEIEEINSMEGSEFRSFLSRVMPRRAPVLYRLKVTFSNVNVPIVIKKDSSMLRNGISQTVTYELRRAGDGKTITSGSFRRLCSYDNSFKPYASYVEGEDVLKNFTKNAAEEIRNRLILYFESREKR